MHFGGECVSILLGGCFLEGLLAVDDFEAGFEEDFEEVECGGGG